MNPVGGAVQAPVPYGDTHYPFSDAATMTSYEDQFVPPDVFTDARLHIYGADESQHISRIEFGVNALSIVVSDSTGELATAKVEDLSAGRAVFQDVFEREVGLLLGDFVKLLAVIPGPRTLTFSPSGLPFAATTIIPIPSDGVEGFTNDDGDYLSGEVWLIGGAGVKVTGDVGTNTVRIDITGDRFFKRKACSSETQSFITPHPLRAITVNGGSELYPDEFGNMQFILGSGGAVDNILRIEPVLNGLRLRIVSGA